MSETLFSIEPATGVQLWQAPLSDIAAEVAQVARGWPAWAAMPLTFRIETMRRFANGVRAAETDLADRIARETGRPLWDCHAEVADVVTRVDKAVGAFSERTGQRRLEGALGARTALRHKPHGVLAVIGPHVLPAQVPASHIIPALIAGNGVLFKPSEKTPATGAMLVSLLHDAGVPEDLLRCVIGGWEAGQALVEHPDVHGILFTGAPQTGLAIARSLADRPDRLLALEMGGNNPVIAWDTPDIESAAALIVQSAFGASGQHCLSARRLIVRDTLAEPLIGAVRALTDRLVIDHPHADPQPYMGPLIDMESADGLTESFLYLMSNGGRPIKHMQRPFDGLPFVTPGIIDVTEMANRADLELFGPLLQIIRVETFEQAIAEANKTRFGLAAALIGGSPEQYDRFWSNARAGIVNWNRPTHALPRSSPAGGVGFSGNHRPGGQYAADNCAYPVVSTEVEQPRASLGVGLRPVEVVADR
ncbi:MAG: N-succinylglutamate 5-semialdehyde dehydrogenase [Sphingobium sp. 66-54]|nr:MAG: N-succinylglutamate 5-semialdehyde dehydrogenase [Sphingobium sp. 66-54]